MFVLIFNVKKFYFYRQLYWTSWQKLWLKLLMRRPRVFFLMLSQWTWNKLKLLKNLLDHLPRLFIFHWLRRSWSVDSWREVILMTRRMQSTRDAQLFKMSADLFWRSMLTSYWRWAWELLCRLSSTELSTAGECWPGQGKCCSRDRKGILNSFIVNCLSNWYFVNIFLLKLVYFA